MRRRAVIFLISCGAWGGVVGGVVACSSLLGDYSVSRDPSSDAASTTGDAFADDSSSDAGPEGPVATVHAIVSGTAVYLGQVAVLDASKSTTNVGTLAFDWAFDMVPPGSSIVAASLTSGKSATPSFTPDLLGSYVLHVKASALGASDMRSATVTVAQPQVLFAQGVAGSPRGDGGSITYSMTGLDGGGSHAVLCADVVSGASGQGAPWAAFSGRASDFWEAPAGQLSRYAAFTIEDTSDGGGLTAHLWAGSTMSSCSSPPADLGTMRFGPGRPWGSAPHFKPDGTRFVVLDDQWRIVTYAADGVGAIRVVSPYAIDYSPSAASVLDPVGIEAGTGYVVEPPRVAWTASGLAWAQPTPDGWEIVKAPDAANATLSTYMTCPGVTPREIAMLADGTVIASYRESLQAPENLYLLKPDLQRHCTHELVYTHLADAGNAVASDFAVSPDGTQIAFLQIDPTVQDASPWTQGTSQLPGGYLYTVPVSGGTPTLVTSDPALYGPTWVAGGAALVFTRLDGIVGRIGRLATSVVVVAPDGGAKHAIAQGDGVTTFVSTSGNAACNAAGGPAGGLAGAWWMIAPLAGWARRRVRRGPAAVIARLRP